MKRIAFLTSSRADYGIYLPLLKTLKKDQFFEVSIIAFGAHLSFSHGYTLNQIIIDGFEVQYQIDSILEGDTPVAISTSMALTSFKFADFWNEHKYDFDIVFCLGDRYEMFAAVIAGIPFGIRFAHLHGGERTLGAIDNVFRHSITLNSKWHFVSCQENATRVAELTESNENIYIIGALGLDNLKSLTLLTLKEFHNLFGVDLNKPTILVTIHPETINPEKNANFADEVVATLIALPEYQVIISLPNADTYGTKIRNRFLNLSDKTQGRIICLENLGMKGYFTAMNFCSFLLGNTSSGIIEAASFGKWVINLGNRQKGRLQSNNIFNVPFSKNKILKVVESIKINPIYQGENKYFIGNAANAIISVLKKLK